ncbi:phosphoribosylglycinamide formyltransferase [Candidatus Tenderia electrophaga]|jgi:phosphoribosylglycinamide formyltransferase-1|uniref:Phosphoribosylglycinamide formyltransferase n=1 Tax=Candidatus Tenderia electrophaga TaxID=1748243 RepID=A0A0S2TBG3_9GAMM|nr:phosphoribosylglycinamide formyltransferase [Candidatus Tenderia electrophaga]
MSQSRKTPLPLVVLISGSGSNLQAIIDACAAGRINAEIKAVISNRAEAYGLERARRAGIPARVVEHTRYSDRQAFDQALAEQIDRYAPGLVVLAGFMRILTDEFVNHYRGRMLNIHPSLLPNFQGLKTHQRALDAGCTEHGVSVHFVTPELDGGPVVCRAVVKIQPGDDAETLAQRVLEQEHRIYPEAIGWFAAGRLQLVGDQAILDGEPVAQMDKTLT